MGSIINFVPETYFITIWDIKLPTTKFKGQINHKFYFRPLWLNLWITLAN